MSPVFCTFFSLQIWWLMSSLWCTDSILLLSAPAFFQPCKPYEFMFLPFGDCLSWIPIAVTKKKKNMTDNNMEMRRSVWLILC